MFFLHGSLFSQCAATEFERRLWLKLCACERSQVECAKTQETERENNVLKFVKKIKKRST